MGKEWVKVLHRGRGTGRGLFYIGGRRKMGWPILHRGREEFKYP